MGSFLRSRLRTPSDPLSLHENPQTTGHTPTLVELARPLPAQVLESHRSQQTLGLTLGWLHRRTRIPGPISSSVCRGQHNQPPELL